MGMIRTRCENGHEHHLEPSTSSGIYSSSADFCKTCEEPVIERTHFAEVNTTATLAPVSLATYHLLTSPAGTISEAIQPLAVTFTHNDSDRAMAMFHEHAHEGDLLLEVPKHAGPSYAFRVHGGAIGEDTLTAIGTVPDELTVAEKLAIRFVVDGHSEILREVQS